eukprot:416690-Pyramimonas_sp.AAC.1
MFEDWQREREGQKERVNKKKKHARCLHVNVKQQFHVQDHGGHDLGLGLRPRPSLEGGLPPGRHPSGWSDELGD